ncbi:MAG: hypothetical protein M1839_003350 [Geoglossum umbratile]|nr:MAG: hypothetical protein M1839_003350 [Geoglossum umbratile]
MSSNDFNYPRQYRPSRGGSIQPSPNTPDHYGPGQGPVSYYQQPSAAHASYPAEYHHRQYIPSRPLDSSNGSDYNSQWYNNTVPGQVIQTRVTESIQVTGGQDATSQVLYQDQRSGPKAQRQRNYQISNTGPSTTPTLNAQQHQLLDRRVSSTASVQANTLQHEQHLQSALPSTLATVNPSHVYNPYYEYHRQIEAAEAERANKAISCTNVDAASYFQSHQELQQPATDKISWSRNPEAQSVTGDSMVGAPNLLSGYQVSETSGLRAQETVNEDIEGMKKREMIGKMMQLMQEDPTIFNQAVKQVKNKASPYSGTQGKTVKKAKAPTRPRVRSKNAVKGNAAKETQAELPEPAGTASDHTPIGSRSQLPGSQLPSSRPKAQPFEPAHPPPRSPQVYEVSSSTITRSITPEQSGSALSLLSRPTTHQSPGPATTQYARYALPHHPTSPQPGSAEPTQKPPFGSTPTQPTQFVQPQPHNAPTKTYATSPGEATSEWPKSEKEALGVNAVRFLISVPENSGRAITPQQIYAILDKKPNYEELCENIEAMGFRLDRVRFAKALLAAVPDSHPITGEPPPANSGEGPVQSGVGIAPQAIGDHHSQHNTHAPMATSGLSAVIQNNGTAHPSSGSMAAPHQPHVRSGALVPVDKPVKRGRGRPRRDKITTQSRLDGTFQQPLKTPNGNSAAHVKNSDSGNALGSAGSEHNDQSLLTQGKAQGTRQGSGDIRSYSQDDYHQMTTRTTNATGSFTPLNGLRTQQEPEPVSAADTMHQHPQQHKQGQEQDSQQAAAAAAAVQRGLIDKEEQDVGQSGSLSSHSLSRRRLNPTNSSSFSPLPLLTTPSLVMANEPSPSPLRRISLADMEHLTQDPYDLEPELPDHLGYLERHQGSDHGHSQATATDELAATANMGAPSRTSTPKSTAASTLQSLASFKSTQLREAFRTDSCPRSRVQKRLAYNPKSICRDLLLVVGKHPATRPLNAHVERIRTKAARVQKRAQLSALYWTAVDRGSLSPILSRLTKSEMMATEKVDATSDDGPETTVHRAPQRPKIREAAKANTGAPANADGPRTEGANLIAGSINSLKRRRSRAGRSSPLSSSSSGAVLSTPASGTALSGWEAGQRDRLSPIGIRGNGPSANNKRHGPSTPARPSGLRHEIALSTARTTPSIVIRSPSSSVLAEYAPFPDDRTSIVTPPPDECDPGPSGFIVFKCKWLRCKAELHNFVTLKKHVAIVHCKLVDEVYQCHWQGCGKPVERCGDGGESSFVKMPFDFESVTLWELHVEEQHLAPVKFTLGLGPRAGPMDDYMPELPHQFLKDTEGRQLMPFTSFIEWRGKGVAEPATSPSADRHLPDFLTKKRTPDVELTPREKEKRRVATVAYGNMLKRQRNLGATIKPLCSLFDQNETRRATLTDENLRMVVKGDQYVLDLNEAEQSKVSRQLEGGITDTDKEGQSTASDELEEGILGQNSKDRLDEPGTEDHGDDEAQ